MISYILFLEEAGRRRLSPEERAKARREREGKPQRSAAERMQRSRQNTGRATFGKDTPPSPVGTTSDVRRETVVDFETGNVIGKADPGDVRTSGRYR